MFSGDVLPHDKEDGGADEAVLDGAGEQVGRRVREQLVHDLGVGAAAPCPVVVTGGVWEYAERGATAAMVEQPAVASNSLVRVVFLSGIPA